MPPPADANRITADPPSPHHMQPLTPRLLNQSLPMLADTHKALSVLLGKSSARNPELQPIILKDPGAAVAILRQLHASRPDATANVSDMAHAVSLLGFSALERLLQQVAVIEPDDSIASQALMLAYSQAAHAAHFARFLADARSLSKPDELATSALLQHPALLTLAVMDPEAMLRAGYAIQQGVPAEIACQAELGSSLNQVNRSLADVWGLPELTRAAMDNQNMHAIRSIPVRLAGDLAQVMVHGRCSEETETLTALLGNFLNQPIALTSARLHSEAAEAARDLYLLGYPTAAFECLLLPLSEEADDDAPEELTRLWAKQARDNQQAAPLPPPVPAVASPKNKVPTHRAAPNPAKPDLHGVLTDTLQQMLQHTSANRVMFAMLSRDRKKLQARLVMGLDQGSNQTADLRQLATPVGGKDIFSLLLKKTQSIWLHSDNLTRYQAHLPPPLDILPSEQGWVAMSLFVRHKPMGLFYADSSGTEPLNEQDYQRFRQLCQRATNGLNNLTKAA